MDSATEKKKNKRYKPCHATMGTDTPVKRLFTDEQRMQAVAVLREHNFRYQEVSDKLGVNPTTLRSWALRYKDINTDNVVSVIAQRVETDLGHMRINFISKNYNKMDQLAGAAIERALKLIEDEEDLNKVNNTIKILTDFMGKMHSPEEGEAKPGSTTTINLIQQSIQQLNQFSKKKEG